MEDAYFATVDEVINYFGTDINKGLSSSDVLSLQSKYGKNELAPPARSSWITLIIKQFEDLLVLILLGSAFVSLILGFVEEKESYFEVFIEPSVIMLILIANAIVGVWQESSAEEAIERLKEFEANTAIVLRNNGKKIEINRSELVPGDIVLLSVGEKIPADCRCLQINSRTFQTVESMLTGESRAQYKQLEPINKPKNSKLEIVDQEKKNILFSGTLVVHGRCKAIVILTGQNTSMGNIQKNLMDQDEQKTPLGQKLDEFAEFLSKVILGICILVWVINIGHFTEHGGFFKGGIYYLKIAVALAVAAIPEGLPAVVTTCLALGTMKMAKKNAIVRSLPSVETLGCTTVICSDKTGTLTTNQMSVRKLMVIQDVGSKKKVNRADICEYGVTGTTFDPRGKILNNTLNKEEETFACATNPSLRKISQISCLCNDASLSFEKVSNTLHWHITGEPTEGALKVLSEKLGCPDASECKKALKMDVTESYNFTDTYWNNMFNRMSLFEFTRERKSMSVLVKDTKHNHEWLLCKGAPESILQRCTHVFCNEEQNIVELTNDILLQIETVYQKYASEGLRCLAMAYRDWTNVSDSMSNLQNGTNDNNNNNDNNDNNENDNVGIDDASNDYLKIESKMVFVGIVGMLDPPRSEVKNAISICNEAGIRVVVITGDNKKTAEAICHEIGVFNENENLKGKSFEGSEFMSFSKNKQLSLIRNASLFSRVMPRHKLHLVELLQSLGEVCAMTGDGVNDAPALSKADIGIGMGTGTEVARHSSDMILADDNFATIVAAVEEGRAIYSNTKQFIRYLISSNIGEVACIFLTAALGLPESLIPVQLLWVNLVTDGLPATALGFNKPDKDIMQQPPRGRTEKIINGWMFFRYALIGLYIGVATILGFVWWFVIYENGPQISYTQLTNFHSCGLDTTKGILYFGENSEWSNMKWNNEALDCSLFHNPRPCTVSLSILVTIEMFNTFNALSENQSLLINPPWSNIWVVLAVILSMLLHCMILYFQFFRSIFATAAMNYDEWMAVLIISFPVIIFDEILKIFSRKFASSKNNATKKDA